MATRVLMAEVSGGLVRGRPRLTLWNDLVSPVFDGVGQAGFKSKANASLLA